MFFPLQTMQSMTTLLIMEPFLDIVICLNHGFPLPWSWEDVDGVIRQYIVHAYSTNTITLFAYQTGDVLDPTGIVEEYRFMLITDNTVTGSKSASAEADILLKLAKAGVDVKNYYEVMDYFGLKY